MLVDYKKQQDEELNLKVGEVITNVTQVCLCAKSVCRSGRISYTSFAGGTCMYINPFPSVTSKQVRVMAVPKSR